MCLGIAAAIHYDIGGNAVVGDVKAATPDTQGSIVQATPQKAVGPEIVCVRVGTALTVEYDGGYAEWDTGKVDYGSVPTTAAIATFRNVSGDTAEVVRATLEYFDESGERVANVDNGCWLGEQVNWATIEPADTAHLVLAMFESIGTFAVDDRRRDAGDEHSGVTPRPLPQAGVRVRATLHVQDGNYRPLRRRSEEFQLKYAPNQDPTVRQLTVVTRS